MRVIVVFLMVLALHAGSFVSDVLHVPGVAGTVLAQQGQSQVPSPTVDPTETNAATWATLIWVLVGLTFLVLLVGAILLGVRSTGNRPPSSWRWRRRNPE